MPDTVIEDLQEEWSSRRRGHHSKPGLAAAKLLRTLLRTFWRRGYTRFGPGVDPDSPFDFGAQRIYERADKRWCAWLWGVVVENPDYRQHKSHWNTAPSK